MSKPYVGITGFMKRSEVESVMRAASKAINRWVMIGVLASLKTLRGFYNKHPNRYPRIGDIKNIFSEHPMALNLIHYNTDESQGLFDQMLELVALGGKGLHGFQLNVAWPLPEVLCVFKELYPSMVLVLQMGGKALAMVDFSPEKLARKIKNEYDSFVNYVLIDQSGGLGKMLDVAKTAEYLRAIKKTDFPANLVVAGGLRADNLMALKPLVDEFPKLGIDAESGLRNFDDHLEVIAARRYLQLSSQLFYG